MFSRFRRSPTTELNAYPRAPNSPPSSAKTQPALAPERLDSKLFLAKPTSSPTLLHTSMIPSPYSPHSPMLIGSPSEAILNQSSFRKNDASFPQNQMSGETPGEKLFMILFRKDVHSVPLQAFTLKFVHTFCKDSQIDEEAIGHTFKTQTVVTPDMLDHTIFSSVAHSRNVSKMYITAIIDALVKEFAINTPEDLVRVGNFYFRGTDLIPQNSEKAFMYFSRAIKSKGIQASPWESSVLTNIGVCYLEGLGVGQSDAKAIKFFRNAADMENPEAMLQLAGIYRDGKGVAADENEAYKWLKLAASCGLPEAIYQYARYYFSKGSASPTSCDEGMVRNHLQKSVSLFEVAAKNGHVQSQYELAYCLQNGKGVAVDIDLAQNYYRLAAEKGHSSSQYALGNILECFGDTSNQARIEEAAKWYLAAAMQGNELAQSSLGICYLYGKGVHADTSSAFKWFKSSAQKGLAAAQNQVGECLQLGIGTAIDIKEAVHWYKKGAMQHFPPALNNLAVCYQEGRGITRDLDEALRLYMFAAEKGDSCGQFNLASLYQQTERFDMAIKWFDVAAAHGDKEAGARLDDLCLAKWGLDFDK